MPVAQAPEKPRVFILRAGNGRMNSVTGGSSLKTSTQRGDGHRGIVVQVEKGHGVVQISCLFMQ